jgi:hypothetical protein
MTSATTILAIPLLRYVFRDEIKDHRAEHVPIPAQL